MVLIELNYLHICVLIIYFLYQMFEFVIYLQYLH